jgi:SOS-response transcriptional repressor LexA
MNLNREVITRIHSLMARRSVDEPELRRLTGIPQSSLNRILNSDGENIKISATIKIAQALNTSPSYILFNEGNSMLNKTVPLIQWDDLGVNLDNYPTQVSCPVECSDKTFATIVKGSTMTTQRGRSYPEGTVIYVDLNAEVVVGDQVLAMITDESKPIFSFKEFSMDGGRGLRSLNLCYPIIYRPFEVLGKVIFGAIVAEDISDEQFDKYSKIAQTWWDKNQQVANETKT